MRKMPRKEDVVSRYFVHFVVFLSLVSRVPIVTGFGPKISGPFGGEFDAADAFNELDAVALFTSEATGDHECGKFHGKKMLFRDISCISWFSCP